MNFGAAFQMLMSSKGKANWYLGLRPLFECTVKYWSKPVLCLNVQKENGVKSKGTQFDLVPHERNNVCTDNE